ncbi:SMI1/KNR4 family protein [Pseudomonas sp. B21-032]|uniref:SMI1/KNR4 family protein n=1 Tax=Pseudomonas sp. B21-032 TaxID=2895483 RepID=UPI00215FAD1B|nr:SMI1/KNR4 family protein [Pseudomonas sp. B21-032]UVL63545.1 SMI1/KNR4 family protein [Pseudomonas sp. B21-032]
MFQDLKNNSPHGSMLSKLQPVASSMLAHLNECYPSLPEDYSSFLKEFGSGAVGAEQPLFILYDGLLAPNEIYDADSATALEGILLFGDDMQGYCAGFDTAWQVVEIDPLDGQAHVVAASFQEYLRDLLN